MRNLLLILVAVVGVNALSNATPPADSTIEQLADAPKFVDPEPVAEPVKKPWAIWASYSDAHFAAQDTGNLAIFIKQDRCDPCDKALPVFTELAASGGYAAVVLDTEKDAELISEMGATASLAPQIIIYKRTNGEWDRHSVIGNKPSEIKRVMAGNLMGAGDYAPYGYCPYCNSKGVSRERSPNGNDRCERGHVYPSRKAVMAGANATPGGLILSTPGVARPCSCESCPRDCVANGCSCGKQPAGSGCASCGVSQGLPRMFRRGRR